MAQLDGRREPWSTKKKVNAERGLTQLRDGRWRITSTCRLGCLHREVAGRVKGDARTLLAARRTSTRTQAAWCPAVLKTQERAAQQAAVELEAKRISFKDYAQQYVDWCRTQHRGFRTDQLRVKAMVRAWGGLKLDQITTVHVEHFLAKLLDGRKGTTVNRYTTALSGLFSRAVRHGFLTANPVQGITRHPEPSGRVIYLTPATERAVLAALNPDHHALFQVSLHTGMRWSEQVRLTWKAVDFLTGSITIEVSKSGKSRVVPMNSVVREILTELATVRRRLGDSRERVFADAPPRPDYFYPAAIERAKGLLARAGQDVGSMEGQSWHALRHTFASRLVAAGVDLRSVQALGGWASLVMVQRYSHMSPEHLMKAVERLVPKSFGPAALASN